MLTQTPGQFMPSRDKMHSFESKPNNSMLAVINPMIMKPTLSLLLPSIRLNRCLILLTTALLFAPLSYSKSVPNHETPQPNRLLLKLAQLHVHSAQFELARFYALHEAPEKAVYWLKTKVKQSSIDHPTLFNIGFYSEKNKQYKQALHYYLMDAETFNNSMSEVQLGYFYLNGMGVTKNTTKAIYWWTKAANHGSPTAEYDLGFVYEHDKQYSDAKHWYQQSATHGYKDAEAALNRLKASEDYAKSVDKNHKSNQQVVYGADATRNTTYTNTYYYH